jgi:hypothetical protein
MIKVVYIGQDEGYFNTLKEVFASGSPGESFEYATIWQEDSNTFQSLTIDIINECPDIVFFDYSHRPLKVLTLARTIPRILHQKKAFIGLWEYLSQTRLLSEGNILGIPVSHIKSGEFGDVVSHAMFLHTDGKEGVRDFAKVQVKNGHSLELSHQMKIGFLTREYIHLEHDMALPKEGTFKLDCHLFHGFPIKDYTLLREIDENFYYSLDRCSDIAIEYTPVLEAPEGETEKDRKWREHEMKELGSRNVDALDKWFKGFLAMNKPKRTRLLVIDKNLSIIKQADRPLDQYDYSIRFYQELDDNGVILKRIKAGIICYQCPEAKEGEINELITEIKKIPGYDPFIIIFGSPWTSEEVKSKFNYSQAIAHKDQFSLIQLLDFCQSYKDMSGREKTHDQSKSYHDKEERIYMDKNSIETYVEFLVEGSVFELSESNLKLQTTYDLPMLSIYSLKWPVPMIVTIVKELNEPEWKEEGKNQYQALIHCIGEEEKSLLRKSVNDMIAAEEERKAEEARLKAEEEALAKKKKEEKPT